MHQQPAWIAAGLPRTSLPATERIAADILSLPIYPELPAAAIDAVAAAV